MKSTPVSVPPPLPAELPKQGTAVQEVRQLPAEANGPTSTPSRAPSRLPKSRRWSLRTKILATVGIAILIIGGVVGAVVVAKPFKDARTDLITHKVHYDRLELNIVERGNLESTNNHDIVCRVKARSQQSQTSTNIKWIIDDGSQVRRNRPKSEALSIIAWDAKTSSYIERPGNPNGVARVVEVRDNDTGGSLAGLGSGNVGGGGGFAVPGRNGDGGNQDSGRTIYPDLLVDLDESGLVEQLKAQKITLDQAESGKVKAEEDYKIQVSQNESDIKTAEITLELAKIDLEKYLKGDFPQALKDVEGRIKVAESDVEQQRDRAAWAQRMLKKGYYTVSQSDAEQSKLQSYELTLAKVMEERRVLTDKDYGLKKRTETDYTNKVAEAKRALERIKSQAHAKEVQARTDEEKKKSVYDQELTKYKDIEEEIKKCKLYAPIDGLVVYYVPEQTRFGVGRQALVAQGESVAENQKLMQIPDLTHMLVNAKVHEALVSRLHKGLPASVRVDAMAERHLGGHVETIANTPSQQDFFASDVKVYPTKIYIDEEVEGLKPGMTAEVKISVADALEHVLTLPIPAIIGSAELGATRKCFVMTPDGPQEREIVVGMSSDEKAEIRSGLMEGDEVVINPKALVGDKVKTRQPGEMKEQSRNGGSGPEGGRKGGKGAKAEGGGGPQNGGPKGGPGPGAKGGQQMQKGNMPFSQEEAQKRFDEMRQATPEKRKELLEKVPEQFRGRVKDSLKAQGIDIKD